MSEIIHYLQCNRHFTYTLFFLVWYKKEAKFQVLFNSALRLSPHTMIHSLQANIVQELFSPGRCTPYNVHPTHIPIGYWMFYRWPGSSPPPVSKLSLFLSLHVCRRSRLNAGEGGGAGEEPNHTTARKPRPHNIFQYSLHERRELNFLNYWMKKYIYFCLLCCIVYSSGVNTRTKEKKCTTPWNHELNVLWSVLSFYSHPSNFS